MMKTKLKVLLSCAVATFVASTGLADDLLNILDGKKTTIEQKQVVQAKSEFRSHFEKVLRPVSAEQRIFLGFVEEKKYEKAMYQWSSAFPRGAFTRSPTGRALYSYVLLKNGLEVNAVETLFRIKAPQKIDRLLKRRWQAALKADNPVWEIAKVKWAPGWTQVFDQQVEMAVLSRQNLNIKNQKRVLQLLRKTSENTKARAWLQWQAALSLAMNGDTGKAAKVLRLLLDAKESHVGKDLIRVTVGRLLFESGYLDAAIKHYKEVPKSSEFWFTAQEEMAWAYIRKGEPQNTLAVTKSLTEDEFSAFVGPEALFLSSLGHLKVCDYKKTATDLVNFKTRYKAKAKNLIELVGNGATPAVESVLKKLKTQRLRLVSMGPEAMKLPLYVSRDEVLRNYVRLQAALEKEAELSSALYANSLKEGTAEVGFQAFLEDLNKALQMRAQTAKQASITLIQKRAKTEIAEIKEILQKMHIVEAELIQQVSTAERVIQASRRKPDSEKVGTSQQASRFSLRFPFVGERWFDEIGQYQMSLKNGCKAKK